MRKIIGKDIDKRNLTVVRVEAIEGDDGVVYLQSIQQLNYYPEFGMVVIK